MQALKNLELPADYEPSEEEEYMNENQLLYFKIKLEDWKNELLQESNDTLSHLKEDVWQESEEGDQASITHETAIELRTRDRYRKLINKIDQALKRIETGDYGYCTETDEPIGIKRLQARPIATMTVEAQEAHELEEKLYKDDNEDNGY